MGKIVRLSRRLKWGRRFAASAGKRDTGLKIVKLKLSVLTVERTISLIDVLG